ncbi:hypothetical protein ACVINZ_006451 [Mesorhizobium jarvisii]
MRLDVRGSGEVEHTMIALKGDGADRRVAGLLAPGCEDPNGDKHRAMVPLCGAKVGKIGNTVFAGSPGNPNAALIAFPQIVLPALRRLAGLGEIHPQWFPALAGFSCKKRRGRTEFVPVRISGRTETGAPVIEMLERGSSAN